MNKLIFKTFTWPTNPENYREELVREPVYVKNEDGENEFAGMGPVKRVITGSGAFFGADAYANYNRLAALFTEGGVGGLNHPVCGNKQVQFTRLQMNQSPRADYVAYSFEFTEVDDEGAIPR